MSTIPGWVKVAYSAWMAVWIPVYWIYNGPANFLWFCDVANLVILFALWRSSALLFSSQTVSVLLVQVAWTIDFATALVVGLHPFGGTEYMFDAGRPLGVRALSLFHVVMPFFLIWGTIRLGYDRRGWRLQTVFTWLLLPIAYLLTDPADNINWLWRPFGIEQTLVPPFGWFLVCLAAYPAVLFWPSHRALLAWARRSPKVAVLPR